jgi:hypothetical protein
VAKTKNIIIGCAIATVVCLVGGLMLIGGCVYYLAQDPTGVSIELDNATEAHKGQEFDMVVKVVNERRARAFKLTDIDLHDDYLTGFIVVSTDPPHKSSTHVPLDNSQSFTFDVSIPAKESRIFKFRLRPVTQGVFKGDVDVCEGMHFITKTAETEVK